MIKCRDFRFVACALLAVNQESGMTWIWYSYDIGFGQVSGIHFWFSSATWSSIIIILFSLVFQPKRGPQRITRIYTQLNLKLIWKCPDVHSGEKLSFRCFSSNHSTKSTSSTYFPSDFHIESRQIRLPQPGFGCIGRLDVKDQGDSSGISFSVLKSLGIFVSTFLISSALLWNPNSSTSNQDIFQLQKADLVSQR